VTEDNRIVKQLHGIAARLTGDLDLQKDLMQEMFIHLVQVETDRPGQTLSWYLQGCHFRARDYLDRGRSINSIKRSNNLVPLDQRDDDDDSLGVCPDAPDPVDLYSELIARDIVDLLILRLTVVQQQILFLLMYGFGVYEIARELGNKRDIAIRVNNIGEVRKLRGDFDGAIPFYKEALDGFRQIGHRTGSTDMGDLSMIMPVLHPYMGGATGSGHGADYQIVDQSLAYLGTAKGLAGMVIDLLAEGAAGAKDVLKSSKPPMTREQYLTFQRGLAKREIYEG